MITVSKKRVMVYVINTNSEMPSLCSEALRKAEKPEGLQFTAEVSVGSPGSEKLAACILSRQLASDLGIEWIWGRIFSVYGKYEPRGRMLPDLIAALLAGEGFSLSAATQYWDYLYSSDCAEALVALGEYGRQGEIYNIANGDCRPLKKFTEDIRSVVAPSMALSYGVKPAGPIYSLMVKAEKLKRDTGWKPKIEFVEGIRLMCNESGDKK